MILHSDRLIIVVIGPAELEQAVPLLIPPVTGIYMDQSNHEFG